MNMSRGGLLLTMLLIIGIFVWIGVVSRNDGSRQSHTMGDMQILATANAKFLEEYGLYAHRLEDLYPYTDASLDHHHLKDAWGHKWVYTYNDEPEPSYKLMSLGADSERGPSAPREWTLKDGPHEPDLVIQDGQFTQWQVPLF